MSASDCIALKDIPHTSRMFLDYSQAGQAEAGTTLPKSLQEYFALAPQSDAWTTRALPQRHAEISQVSDLLEQQNRRWGAGVKTLENIAHLRQGARAVVTGQQVTLFGGPLYSLLKAATAIQLAKQASERGVANDLVVHIGHIHHMPAGNALLLQKPAQHIDLKKSPEVPDMPVVIHGRPTGIHAKGCCVRQNQVLDRRGESIEKSYGHCRL